MTLGVGCVVEQGAVLLVDSALTLHHPDGTTSEITVDDKLLMVEAATDRDLRLVVVHAGPSPEVQTPRILPHDGGDFDVAASNVWRELTDIEWADWVHAENRNHDHDVLIAGSVRGQPVKLVHIGTRTATDFAAEGVIFSIGLISQMWQPTPRPRNMAEAIGTGLELASLMMRNRMAEAARLGEKPGVGWPLHAALITPDRIDIHEFGETHRMCQW